MVGLKDTHFLPEAVLQLQVGCAGAEVWYRPNRVNPIKRHWISAISLSNPILWFVYARCRDQTSLDRPNTRLR